MLLRGLLGYLVGCNFFPNGHSKFQAVAILSMRIRSYKDLLYTYKLSSKTLDQNSASNAPQCASNSDGGPVTNITWVELGKGSLMMMMMMMMMMMLSWDYPANSLRTDKKWPWNGSTRPNERLHSRVNRRGRFSNRASTRVARRVVRRVECLLLCESVRYARSYHTWASGWHRASGDPAGCRVAIIPIIQPVWQTAP